MGGFRIARRLVPGPVLVEYGIKGVGRLPKKFHTHYEQEYCKHRCNRVKICKYVFHMLFHLDEGIRQCSPTVGYLQYWMKRYIGWVLGRLSARRVARFLSV